MICFSPFKFILCSDTPAKQGPSDSKPPYAYAYSISAHNDQDGDKLKKTFFSEAIEIEDGYFIFNPSTSASQVLKQECLDAYRGMSNLKLTSINEIEKAKKLIQECGDTLFKNYYTDRLITSLSADPNKDSQYRYMLLVFDTSVVD